MDESKSLDILGVKPVAEAVGTVTTGVVAGASAFLSRICLPAAEEFGLLLQDRVRGWRSRNTAAVLAKAEELLHDQTEPVQAPPRLVGLILEHGSWIENSAVQQMWGGLLASSCSVDGEDDDNLMFVDLLSRMTTSQVRLLDAACSDVPKYVAPNGLLLPLQRTIVPLEKVIEMTGVTDLLRLDREMDHLRSLGLIIAGFDTGSQGTFADVTPTPLALQMYAKCNGCRTDPRTFYGLAIPEVTVTGTERAQ
jgi:hypothetical protein